jgi:hypothetical protein
MAAGAVRPSSILGVAASAVAANMLNKPATAISKIEGDRLSIIGKLPGSLQRL